MIFPDEIDRIESTTTATSSIKGALSPFPAPQRIFKTFAGAFWKFLVLLAILSPFEFQIQAQTITGDIVGAVTDKDGHPVPEAMVTITSAQTNEQRTARTNVGGEYVINLLKPGGYSVRIEREGFQSFLNPELNLAAGDRAKVDASLRVGAKSETVTVTGAAPELQTESSSMSTTIAGESIQDLPLNGRNFVQLAQITPGANEGLPNGLGGGGKPDDRRQTSTISVNGQADVVNNEMIDGMDNNERIIGTIGVRPSVDAIGEMRVLTNLYTAEVGRSAAGVVNVITKSGTNQLHGSAYEFLRNDKMDAKDFFATGAQKPKLRLNQFGGSIGGPIRKDHTFFFGDYEQYNKTSGSTTLTNVPTLYEEMHLGDFSDTGGPVLAPNQIDPTGALYFQLYPAPNTSQPGGNYLSIQNQTQTNRTFDVRVDHSFNPSNLFFSRVTYNKVDSFIPGLLPAKTVAGLKLEPGGNVNAFSGPAVDRAVNGQLNYIRIFTPNLLLELKAGYTRIDNESLPLNLGTYAANKFFNSTTMNVDANTSYLTPIYMSGVAADLGVGVFVPLKDIDNTFQYMGSVTYTVRTHNIKMGASLIRRQATNIQDPAGVGQYQVLDIVNLVEGNIVNSTRQNQLYAPHYRIWEPSVYVQDDWRLTKNLTLNLGVRYDIFTPFTEAHGHISNFDPKTDSIVIPGQNGVSASTGIPTIKTNLAPRFGFSLTPRSGTVLRGGFGLSFFPATYSSNASLQNVPFVSTFGPCSPPNCIGSDAAHTSYNTLSAGLPAPGPLYSDVNNPNTIITATDLNYHPSYLEQFNLTAQQQVARSVVTVAYVGMLGRRMAIEVPDLNAPAPNTCGAPSGYVILTPCLDPSNNPNNLRPFAPKYQNQITEHVSEGSSSYHSLQASIERRFDDGLAFNLNYTWAHGIDDMQAIGIGTPTGLGVIPSLISKLDRGNSDYDVRDRIAAFGNYEIPLGKNLTGAKGLVVKGWSLNTIFAWQTGLPYTVVNNISQSNGLPNGEGNDRPNVIANPKPTHQGVGEWFNQAAFQPQPFGTLGNESRNPFHGPRYRHLDLSVFKSFPLWEHAAIQFRAEAFNITNTANFNRPNSSLSAIPDPSNPGQFLPGSPSGGFGTIQNTVRTSTPRQLQLALKLTF